MSIGSGREFRIDLFGEVDDKMLGKIWFWKNGSPTIWLCSEGGSAGHGFAIYDYIRRHHPRSQVIASGLCCSAALIVLQAGAKRLATPNTMFLEHKSYFEITKEEEDNEAPEVKQERERIASFSDVSVRGLFVQHTSAEKYDEALRLGVFDPKTALRLGLIDEIL